MPKGPRGEKRPADAIGRAVQIMRIATGEEDEDKPDKGKDAAAVELGRKGGAKGGKARADSLTSERRREIAKKAARARWESKS